MLRIPFATWIAHAAVRLDGTYGVVTHQAGRTYFHGSRRTGDSGVPGANDTRIAHERSRSRWCPDRTGGSPRRARAGAAQS